MRPTQPWTLRAPDAIVTPPEVCAPAPTPPVIAQTANSTTLMEAKADDKDAREWTVWSGWCWDPCQQLKLPPHPPWQILLDARPPRRDYGAWRMFVPGMDLGFSTSLAAGLNTSAVRKYNQRNEKQKYKYRFFNLFFFCYYILKLCSITIFPLLRRDSCFPFFSSTITSIFFFFFVQSQSEKTAVITDQLQAGLTADVMHIFYND